jgi:hypothetical protein
VRRTQIHVVELDAIPRKARACVACPVIIPIAASGNAVLEALPWNGRSGSF